MFFVLIVITSIIDIVVVFSHGANIMYMRQEAIVCVFALSLLLMLFINTRAQAKKCSIIDRTHQTKILSTQASKELVDAKRILGDEISKQFYRLYRLVYGGLDIRHEVTRILRTVTHKQ